MSFQLCVLRRAAGLARFSLGHAVHGRNASHLQYSSALSFRPDGAARSFQTSPPALKMTPKQQRMLKNDLRYQAELRIQKEQEELMKKGEGSAKAGRRVVLRCTPQIVEPGLPAKHPPRGVWPRIKYAFHRLAQVFTNTVIHPIRLMNMRRKENLPRFKRGQIEEAVSKLYVMFQEDRAAGRLQNLQTFVSEPLFADLSSEIAKRAKLTGVELKWQCENLRFRRRSFRLVAVPPPISMTVLQVVYDISSHQSVTAVKVGTNEPVTPAGEAPAPVPVRDRFGFELVVDKPDATWFVIEQMKD